MAIWAAGPPKAVIPSLLNSRASSFRSFLRYSSFWGLSSMPKYNSITLTKYDRQKSLGEYIWDQAPRSTKLDPGSAPDFIGLYCGLRTFQDGPDHRCRWRRQ